MALLVLKSMTPNLALIPNLVAVLTLTRNAVSVVSCNFLLLLLFSRKSSPTLSDPMDCSPPGSSTHGILQARTLEWAAISSFRRSCWPRDPTRVFHLAGKFFTTEPPGKWFVGSYFPGQGLNLSPKYWKCWVLTIGLPGSSLEMQSFYI